MSTSDQGWLSISAYARYYGVSRHTVWKWLQGGLLELYRVGRCVRVRHQPPTVAPKSTKPARKRT